MTLPSTILAALAVTLLTTIGAQAGSAPAVNKTWVSSAGTDSGSCQLSAPCRTFAYAISETNAGGEVDVKDSGAYGAFTVTKDITIVSSGAVASVGIGTNNKAILVETDNVHVDIVGLTINTHNKSSYDIGVFASCSKCVISLDHTNVQGNNIGVETSAGTIIITNSHIAGNGTGVVCSGGAIYIGNNTISQNEYGISGCIYSYGNNEISGNSIEDEYSAPTVISTQ